MTNASAERDDSRLGIPRAGRFGSRALERWWKLALEALWRRPRGSFPALDGLRALAILGVILFHCCIFIGLALPEAVAAGRMGFLRPLLVNLWTGVDVFFVLSGFLIGRILIADLVAARRVNYAAFLVRRVSRIFPLYYLVLTVSAFVIAPTAPGPFNLLFGTTQRKDLLAGAWTNYAFLSNYLRPMEAANILSWGWSLCVEEHFYLLLPPALWLLFRTRDARFRLGGIGVLLVAPLVGRLLTFWRNPSVLLSQGYYDYSHFRFDELLVGVLIAYLFVVERERLFEWARRAGPALGVLGTAGIGAVLLFGSARQGGFFAVVLQFSLVAAGTGLLVVNSVCSSNALTRILSSSGWYPIARVSYGMYLVHPFVLFYVLAAAMPSVDPARMGPGGLLLLYLCVAGASFLIASVIFVLLERPLLKRGADISRQLRRV